MSNLPPSTPATYSNFITGLAFGYAKIGIVQPLWTVKLRLQQGKPFTINPNVLFKGMGFNVIGYPLATATQLSIYNSCLVNYEQPYTNSQKLSCGFVAGMISGAVICLNDFVMTQHSLRNLTYKDTLVELVNTYKFKNFFTGIAVTSLREGGYATCFLVAPGLFQPIVNPYVSSDLLQNFIASLASGVIASFITQPADTIKSAQQTSVINFKDAAKIIYKNNGSLGFFKGALPRCAQVTSGIMLLHHLKQNYLEEDNNAEPEVISPNI